MNIKRYGGDAPFALLIYTVFGVGLLWHAYVNRLKYPIGIETTMGIILVLGALIFLHTTAQGKYRLFDEAMHHLNLKPDSQMLDLGCGRGALLTRIAQQLRPAGKVTGLDLWLSRDQSHNKMAVTQKDVDDFGLTDRVNLVTGDMTKLDFPDESFAIHNIKNEQARINAVKEAIRVLKPGGHIMIIDTGRNINEYGQVFQDSGLQITQSMGLGFNGWWATPLTDSYVMAGNKPVTKTAKQRLKRELELRLNMSEKATEVTQREMIRIIGLFRKQGFKGNYLSFQHVVDEGATYFVVMGDENNGNQGLFKANLLTGEVAFQYMLDEDHVVSK